MRTTKLLAMIGIVPIVVGLLAFTSFVGCEKAAKEMGERATEQALKAATGKDTDIQVDGKTVKIKQEGSTTELAETSEWPSDMFPEVPKFTFGKVTNVSKGEDQGMMKFNIFLKEMESGCGEKYVDLLRKAGWRVDITKMGPRGEMIAGEKGDLGMNFLIGTEKKEGMLAVFRIAQN